MKILRVLFVAAALASASAYPHPQPQDVSARVVDGANAGKYDAPFMVSLRYPGWWHFCGGTLISDRWILTAASCLFYPAIEVVAGAVDRNDDSTKQIRTATAADYVIHEGFNGLQEDDIAVVYISKPFNMDMQAVVQTIMLPRTPFGENQEGTLFGYGYYDDSLKYALHLQRLNVTIINYERCNEEMYFLDLSSSRICSLNGKRSSAVCEGDAGGPLVAYRATGDAEIVGIIPKLVVPCKITANPNIYLDVHTYRPWITQNTKYPPSVRR